MSDPERIATLEQKVHRGINAARSRNGGSTLKWVDKLGEVARAHSEDMVERGYYGHDSPEGLGPTDRGARAGYDCRKATHYGIAENITMVLVVYKDLDHMGLDHMVNEVVQSWLDSHGHRTNLLDGRFDRTGIGASFGLSEGFRAVYVTQVFC